MDDHRFHFLTVGAFDFEFRMTRGDLLTLRSIRRIRRLNKATFSLYIGEMISIYSEVEEPESVADWNLRIDNMISDDYTIIGKRYIKHHNPERPKRNFELEWRMEKGENEKGDRVNFLVVQETDLESYPMFATARIPATIKRDAIAAIVSAKPPYGEDNSLAIASWRNIDRIVGATLSYSFPPPTPKHS